LEKKIFQCGRCVIFVKKCSRHFINLEKQFNVSHQVTGPKFKVHKITVQKVYMKTKKKRNNINYVF